MDQGDLRQNLSELDYTRYYEKWHSDTPEHINAMSSFYKRILGDVLPFNRESNILDVGCGMGYTLISLTQLGYSKILGIDIDIGQIESCKRKGLNVSHVTNTVEYLENLENQFDLIICLDVIEHIPHDSQVRFVNSINKALVSKGKLICTVPNANSILASRWLYNDWTHHFSFTEHSLDFLLFNTGFQEIVVSETEFFEKPNLNPLSMAVFTKGYWKAQTHWWLFRLVRLFHRLTMIAELGWDQGKTIPLSLNILATAVKP